MMNIKIGTVLILEPTKSKTREKFRCKVVEEEEQKLFIDYPVNIETNKTVYLLDGSQFRATFEGDEKKRYVFHTKVLGRKKENIPLIMMAKPQQEEIIRLERREFVRVKTPVDVAVEFAGELDQFVTEDISAGGLAFIFPKEPPFSEGEIVKLTIVLPYNNGEILYVQSEAMVVQISEYDGQIRASLQFTNIEEVDKQNIVRFCFEREVMNRKQLLDR